MSFYKRNPGYTYEPVGSRQSSYTSRTSPKLNGGGTYLTGGLASPTSPYRNRVGRYHSSEELNDRFHSRLKLSGATSGPSTSRKPTSHIERFRDYRKPTDSRTYPVSPYSGSQRTAGTSSQLPPMAVRKEPAVPRQLADAYGTSSATYGVSSPTYSQSYSSLPRSLNRGTSGYESRKLTNGQLLNEHHDEAPLNTSKPVLSGAGGPSMNGGATAGSPPPPYADDQPSAGRSLPFDSGKTASATTTSSKSTGAVLEAVLEGDRSTPTGLYNGDNTCYQNSSLQCLAHIKPLRLYIENDDQFRSDLRLKASHGNGLGGFLLGGSNGTSGSKIAEVFHGLMVDMWRSGDSYLRASRFKASMARLVSRYGGGRQHDAMEFLQDLMRFLHADLNRAVPAKKGAKVDRLSDEQLDQMPDREKADYLWQLYTRCENSVLVDIFVGQLKSTLTCQTCKHRSSMFDPIWELSVPLPRPSSSTTLDNCFELYFACELLDKDEKPKCERCKSAQPHTKQLSMHKFPSVLLIHLKRFSSGSWRRSKLSDQVSFPLNKLDLSRYVAETCPSGCPPYQLRAVINHYGTVDGGHYTAYCLSPATGRWSRYNDDRVSPIQLSSVCTSDAYILFYERTD